MKHLPLLTVALCLALIVPAAMAEPIVIGETETLTSKILDEERTLMVHLPLSYEGSEAVYPVVYLLDARTRFHHTTGTLASLARSGHVPEMIVVGIVNTNRTRDLTPPWTKDERPEDRVQVIEAGGGADTFLRFLREELIPHVDERYRTAPFRVLVGHSFGGLFAAHAFVNDPDLFQGVISISPSLWWDAGKSVEQARALFDARPDLSGRLYLTLADEGDDMLTEFKNMETLLTYRAPAGLSWQAHVLDGEDHGSIPIPTVHAAFKSFFSRWRVPFFGEPADLATVDAHHASLSREYGYRIQTPEALINNLGYQALGSQDVAKAIEIFRANVERYPASANVYDSLGEAMEAAGSHQEALELYTKAYELGRDTDDPNLAAYAQHRDALSEKLAAAR